MAEVVRVLYLPAAQPVVPAMEPNGSWHVVLLGIVHCGGALLPRSVKVRPRAVDDGLWEHSRPAPRTSRIGDRFRQACGGPPTHDTRGKLQTSRAIVYDRR